MVWGYAMNMAVATAAALHVLRNGTVPERIQVFYDQKVLPPELRMLVRKNASRLGIVTARVARQLADRFPNMRSSMSSYAEAMMLDPSAVSVSWSDEPGFQGTREGLVLADSFVSNMYKETRRRDPKPALKAALAKAGFTSFERDDTQQVIAALPEESLQQWHDRTGLPIPR